MLIIGCDFHTRYQQIAMLDESTGELTERRLEHESGEAHTFYRSLQGRVAQPLNFRVALDENEGAVKHRPLLRSAISTAGCQRRRRTKTLELARRVARL